MNKRRVALLRLLLEQNGTFITMQELADKLSVSTRTLRNDANGISEMLEKEGISGIERRPGTGIRMNASTNEWKQMLHHGYQTEKTSSEQETDERRWLVLYELLMSKKPLTLESLAQEYYVSKPVIREDLKVAQKTAAEMDLHIKTIQNFGTTMEGSEWNKRALLSKTVRELRNFLTREKALKQFFNPVELSVVAEALKKVQQEYSIQFIPEAAESIKLHTLFSIKRLYLNQPIKVSEADHNSIRGTAYYEWASSLAWTIREKLSVFFPANEIAYLALHFKSARMEAAELSTTQETSESLHWVEQFADQLIVEVADLLKVPLEKDEVLKENLVLHLRTTLSRLESGFVISNPLLPEIKKEYTYLFYFIQNILESFNAEFNVILPEEEIGYVTVHFQAALERQKPQSRKLIKIGIVCHYGVGVSAFIQARIERRFPKVEQTVLLAENEVETYLKSEPLTLILTTVPLRELDIPVVQISPLLNEEELNKIETLFETKENHKSTTANDSKWNLIDYSQPFLIYLQQEFTNVEDVLNHMGNVLAVRGYVEADYLDSVIERERRNFTSVGKGIAIPHGNPDLVKQSTISVMTLKEPVKWGNDTISVVFLLGMKKSDIKKEGMKGFFTFLNQLMEKPELLEQLKDETNVMGFLSEATVK